MLLVALCVTICRSYALLVPIDDSVEVHSLLSMLLYIVHGLADAMSKEELWQHSRFTI